MFKHIVMPAFVIALIGCGVSEEEHMATLAELNKVKTDMADSQKKWTAQDDAWKRQTAELEAENGVMKNKLVSLGQDISALKTQSGEMVKDISNKEQQIAELQRAQEAAKKRQEQYQQLLNKFKEMIDSGKLRVYTRNGRMIVQMSDKILFDPGKAELKAEGSAALAEVAKVLATIPDRQFQVAGHTDNKPIKTAQFKSNWELSTSRAVNVVKFLSSNGVDPNRLSAAGYGPFDPVADNNSDEGRQQNRRIEITLVPNVSELPSLPNS